MDPDFPEVGTLVSAGLAAKEIDALSVPDRHGAESGTHHNCLNCGTPLSARYCGSCGQPAHLHRSLLHLSEEFLHGVLHFDAKGVRTAPLLAFRPGLLTRRYIDGQRTRYVSPMALFLFCIFLMYFVFSLAAGGDSRNNVTVNAEGARSAKADLAKAQQEADEDVAQATAKVEQLKKAGADLSEAQQELAEAKFAKKMAGASSAIARAAIDLGSRSAAEARPGPAQPGTPGPADTVLSTDAAVGSATWQEQLAAKAKAHVADPGTKGKIYRALANPDLALYKLKSTAYKLSFMLIPISLPFLWLMFFWKRGVAMYDHGVFSLYSLSFMSLLFTAAALLAMMGVSSTVIALCVIIVPPVHMFAQLRGTYGLGLFGASWRTIALLGICGTAFVLFLLFVIAMTLH